MYGDDGGERPLAPVIPLFGGKLPSAGAPPSAPDLRAPDVEDPGWHPSWIADDVSDVAEPADSAAELEAAEATLLRKLRTRSLSVREARTVVSEREVDADAVEALLERFVRNGYLDDAKLAEQLIHTGVERKGQGRNVVAQTLAKRGIPREVIDAALDELPDDEHERALEFARSKARGMRGLERDVAMRRLSGQLARRGYGGQSLSAARQALDELARGAGSSGVRFT